MTEPIPLDGYVMVKQDDLQALRQANHPAVEDPACPATGDCPEVPAKSSKGGRCGAQSRAGFGDDPPEPLLTVRQAAQQLSLSPSAVHNYIGSHQLPVIRLGRAIRIQPGDLADFISAHTIPASAPSQCLGRDRHNGNGKDPCPT